jgi:magnesium-protoporphyrin IX monomethyl ester (oxidative) cyclase
MRAEEYGLTLTPSRAYSYVYPLSTDALMRLAYSFEDSGHPMHIHRSVQDGPGRSALYTSVRQWNDAWQFVPPQLYVDDDGERLQVTDTRPCALARNRILTGLEATVYRLCETAQTAMALERSGLSWTEAEPAIDALCESRLLLRLNGKLLSLGAFRNRKLVGEADPMKEITSLTT